ncbi:UDP-N-acetylmuramoylalanyl-D-glutamate--L-lysine ligase [Staphylococcus gallinarum]|uniref:UDP-N-acetylmuramoylalanyl-D-glutamate--L-lysine ligase n=1 Tax=Staphylococcus gallinarum TaxID=1293 RepID=A0A380FEJ8_STAGA|nr:UDP-N-acetylmuramoylalanyl-D-glutamate--L-lysine ligase [Staphylococcus gallinarum]
MDANVLFEKIKVKQVKGTLNRAVDDITTDSRTATTGSIFVASKGYTVDSHKFCQDVVDNGCQIVVVNRTLDFIR